MILDELVLRDFGVYRGTQVFQLTPRSRRPIILFGGLNGGGKTTLLDALQLVLFGRHAQLSNRKNLGYHDYLRRSIHTGASRQDGASISLIFHHRSGGEVERLRVERSWYETRGGSVRERLEVTRDPYDDDAEVDALLTDEWSDHVHKFMPANIAPLFFFDGEQIETLADTEHSADVLSTAVSSLLGLDLVDQLVTDLGVLERRKRREDKDDGLAQLIRAAERDIAQARQRHDDVFQQRGEAQSELDTARNALREAERAFKRRGGEAFESRRTLEAQEVALKEQIEELEERLRTLASGAAPLLILQDGLLARVMERDAEEVEAAHASALRNVLHQRDEALLHEVERAGAGSALVERLAVYLRTDREVRSARADDVDAYLHMSDDARSQLSSLRSQVLARTRHTIRELSARIGERRQRLDYLEDRLAAVPSEDAIAEVQRERDQARQAVVDAEMKMRGLGEEVNRRKKQLERQEKDLQRAIEKQRRGELVRDDEERLIRHSTRLRKTLSVFRTRLIERHVQRIEKLILESFRQLLRKQSLISGLSIDPRTFAVELRGRDGHTLSPSRLSAGERQLLAVSMLWGLARASGRPLPAVIDTPLGRLDSEHRTHLVERYFPSASHQVLLLSTDEEIDEDYHAQLEPYITRSYVLEFDDEAGATTGREGYFEWET